MWFSGFVFLILSLIVEVYLWWKLQASLIFLSGRTCPIGGWLNTFLPHCMYTPPFKSLRFVRFYNAFESFLCSPRLYLFDDKYNKCEIILQFKITVLRFKYILKYNLFLWCNAEFSAAITPVFILICWFAAQETFIIIMISDENSCAF